MLNDESCAIKPILIKRTDHQAVSIQLQSVATKTRCRGYRKINNGIIDEQDYKCNIIRMIRKHSIRNTIEKMNCVGLLPIGNKGIQY